MKRYAAAATLLVAALAAAPVAHADTVLDLPGWSLPGMDGAPYGAQVMPQELQGSLCQPPNTCSQLYESFAFITSVPLPHGVYDPNGEAVLRNAIQSATRPTVIFGYSAGASISTQELRDHTSDPVNPNVSFVMIGDSNRVGTSDGGKGVFPTIFGNKVGTPTDSGYPITVVTKQYDGWSDWPANSLNLLADANAIAGMNTLHPSAYLTVDVNDPANIVTHKGSVTDVLVPTRELPLLTPLHGLLPDKTIAKLNAKLKPIVDSAYQPKTKAPKAAHAVTTIKPIRAALKKLVAKIKAHKAAP